MEQSKLYSINWRDALHGLIIAVGSPVVLELTRLLQAGKMDFTWKTLAMVGLSGGLTYIGKKFFEKPAEGK